MMEVGFDNNNHLLGFLLSKGFDKNQSSSMLSDKKLFPIIEDAYFHNTKKNVPEFNHKNWAKNVHRVGFLRTALYTWLGIGFTDVLIKRYARENSRKK